MNDESGGGRWARRWEEQHAEDWSGVDGAGLGGEFQTLFAAGELRADFTGDGVLDLFDFIAFEGAFVAGCW